MKMNCVFYMLGMTYIHSAIDILCQAVIEHETLRAQVPTLALATYVFTIDPNEPYDNGNEGKI